MSSDIVTVGKPDTEPVTGAGDIMQLLQVGTGNDGTDGDNQNTMIQFVESGLDSVAPDENHIYASQSVEVNGVPHVIVQEAQDPETGEALVVLKSENGSLIALPHSALSSGIMQMGSGDNGEQEMMAVTEADANGSVVVVTDVGSMGLTNSILDKGDEHQVTQADTGLVQSIETPKMSLAQDDLTPSDSQVIPESPVPQPPAEEQLATGPETVPVTETNTEHNDEPQVPADAAATEPEIQGVPEENMAPVTDGDAAVDEQQEQQTIDNSNNEATTVSFEIPTDSGADANAALEALAMVSETDGNQFVIMTSEDGTATEITLADVIGGGASGGQTFLIETDEGLVACSAGPERNNAVQYMMESSNNAAAENAILSAVSSGNLTEGQVIQAISDDNQTISYTIQSTASGFQLNPVVTAPAAPKQTPVSRKHVGRQKASSSTSGHHHPTGETLLVTNSGSADSVTITPKVQTPQAKQRKAPAKLSSRAAALQETFSLLTASAPGPTQLASSRRTYSKKNVVWMTPDNTPKPPGPSSVSFSSITSSNMSNSSVKTPVTSPVKSVTQPIVRHPITKTVTTPVPKPITQVKSAPVAKVVKEVSPPKPTKNLIVEIVTKPTSPAKNSTSPAKDITPKVQPITCVSTNKSPVGPKVTVPTVSPAKSSKTVSTPVKGSAASVEVIPESPAATDVPPVAPQLSPPKQPTVAEQKRKLQEEKKKAAEEKKRLQLEEKKRIQEERKKSLLQPEVKAPVVEKPLSPVPVAVIPSSPEKKIAEPEPVVVEPAEPEPIETEKEVPVVEEKIAPVEEKKKPELKKEEKSGADDATPVRRSSRTPKRKSIEDPSDERPPQKVVVTTPAVVEPPPAGEKRGRGRPRRISATVNETLAEPSAETPEPKAKDDELVTPRKRVGFRLSESTPDEPQVESEKSEAPPAKRVRTPRVVRTPSVEAPVVKASQKTNLSNHTRSGPSASPVSSSSPEPASSSSSLKKSPKLTPILKPSKRRPENDPSRRRLETPIVLVSSPEKTPDMKKLRESISSLGDTRSPAECYDYTTDSCEVHVRHQSASLNNYTPRGSGGSYACQKCGYRTSRMNNLVIHHKDHCPVVKSALMVMWQHEMRKQIKTPVTNSSSPASASSGATKTNDVSLLGGALQEPPEDLNESHPPQVIIDDP